MVIPFLMGTLYGLVPRLETRGVRYIFLMTNEHEISSIIARTKYQKYFLMYFYPTINNK